MDDIIHSLLSSILGGQPAQQQPNPLNSVLSANATAPKPSQKTASTPGMLDQAAQQATQTYPWLAKMGVPIKLSLGKGPYMSESYDPKADENPFPGHFSVQLRDPAVIANPSKWGPLLAREGLDYMARNDKTYQTTAQQFRKMMTPDQRADAQRMYNRAKKQHGETRSFEDFLTDAHLQEVIGGYVLGEKNWKSYPYSPQQKKLLNKLQSYMWDGKKPAPIDLD